MASQYPNQIDSLPNVPPGATQDGTDHEKQHNDANDAIRKTQQILGENPQGTEDTVADRLHAIEATPGGVESVNGQTGAVVLEPSDIGAYPADQIVVDTTVGTRVDIGGVTIHYDSGWRALVEWDTQGVTTGYPLSEAYQPRVNTPGGIWTRRRNGEVFIKIAGLDKVSNTPSNVIATAVPYRLPVGFQPASSATIFGPRTPTEFAMLVVNDRGQFYRLSGSAPGTNGAMDMETSFLVPPQLPNTLPGHASDPL